MVDGQEFLPIHLVGSEWPLGVSAGLEHRHGGEGGVGETAEGVAAPLAGRQGRGTVAGQVEGVDERHVVQVDVAGVVLPVVGEDDGLVLPARVITAGDMGRLRLDHRRDGPICQRR
jgi:hypothetical protein